MFNFKSWKRLEAELTRLRHDAHLTRHLSEQFIEVSPFNGNLYHWYACILGPLGSLYYGGKFFVDIRIPADYPSVPPYVRFATIIHHPNIDAREGDIQLDVL